MEAAAFALVQQTRNSIIAEEFRVDEADAIDAVDARLLEVYQGQEPRHFSTLRRWAEGGDAPLDGISVYISHPSHWHFISYGMSPWGFEFSLRVAHRQEANPPSWPIPFLQQLGRYVFNTGEPFGHEHYVAWGGPITDAEPTTLIALLFARDPVLGSITVGGEPLIFLTPLGITAAEYEDCIQNKPEVVLAKLLTRNPLGVLDLRQEST